MEARAEAAACLVLDEGYGALEPALLGTLAVILLLYISPAKHWVEQSRTAGAQQEELAELERDNAELKQRVRTFRDPASLELEARRLGMVREGERAYVIERLPR